MKKRILILCSIAAVGQSSIYAAQKSSQATHRRSSSNPSLRQSSHEMAAIETEIKTSKDLTEGTSHSTSFSSGVASLDAAKAILALRTSTPAFAQPLAQGTDIDEKRMASLMASSPPSSSAPLSAGPLSFSSPAPSASTGVSHLTPVSTTASSSTSAMSTQSHSADQDEKRHFAAVLAARSSLTTASSSMPSSSTAASLYSSSTSSSLAGTTTAPSTGAGVSASFQPQIPPPCAIGMNMMDMDKKQIEDLLQNCPEEITKLRNKLMDRKRLEQEDEESIPRKLLFVGPPGTGKTTMALLLAQSCGMPYFIHAAPGLTNKYQYSGNQKLEKIFSDAAQLKKPCVIIIDELQALMDPEKNTRGSDKSVVNMLWYLLDTYKKSQILFIGTMNSVATKDIQAPFLDRFRRDTIHMILPDEQQRTKTIQSYISKRTEKRKDLKFEAGLAEALAKETTGRSHRVLIDIMEEAIPVSSSQEITITLSDCIKAKAKIDAAYPEESYWSWEGSWAQSAYPYAIALGGLGVGVIGLLSGKRQGDRADALGNKQMKQAADLADKQLEQTAKFAADHAAQIAKQAKGWWEYTCEGFQLVSTLVNIANGGLNLYLHAQKPDIKPNITNLPTTK